MMETGKILILYASILVDQTLQYFPKEICESILMTQSLLELDLINQQSVVEQYF